VVSVTPRQRFIPGILVQEAGWASEVVLDTEARGKILFASAGDRNSIARSSSP
jgi:hypothetical protein